GLAAPGAAVENKRPGGSGGGPLGWRLGSKPPRELDRAPIGCIRRWQVCGMRPPPAPSYVRFTPRGCRFPIAGTAHQAPLSCAQARPHRLAGGSSTLPDLLEAELPAYRPFQNVRADLAQHLHRLAIALPVKHLAFRLRNPGIGAETDRDQMAIFLPCRILFGRERAARKGALERRMVIWPELPRATSLPARRRRSGVGSARRSHLLLSSWLSC